MLNILGKRQEDQSAGVTFRARMRFLDLITLPQIRVVRGYSVRSTNKVVLLRKFSWWIVEANGVSSQVLSQICPLFQVFNTF